MLRSQTLLNPLRPELVVCPPPSLGKVLDILQKVFYRSNPAREAFVELCSDEYVQKMTFDSYLYKTARPLHLAAPIACISVFALLLRCAACERQRGRARAWVCRWCRATRWTT